MPEQGGERTGIAHLDCNTASARFNQGAVATENCTTSRSTSRHRHGRVADCDGCQVGVGHGRRRQLPRRPDRSQEE